MVIGVRHANDKRNEPRNLFEPLKRTSSATVRFAPPMRRASAPDLWSGIQAHRCEASKSPESGRFVSSLHESSVGPVRDSVAVERDGASMKAWDRLPSNEGDSRYLGGRDGD